MPSPSTKLGRATRAAVRHVGEVPTTTRDVVAMAGRSEATRLLSGMDGPPKRADYTEAGYAEARRTWQRTQRRVQRATAGEGAQQRPGTTSTAERRRVLRFARAARERAFRRRGARMRMHAVVTVPSPSPRQADDTRQRWMPSGGPGVEIDSSVMDEVIDLVNDGEADEAGEVLLDEFGTSYGFADFELDDLLVLKLWPEGTTEPR